MSNKIDQRIVEMSFENQKFEKGIHQSKNSLKEFSNALNNMGTGKDFKGLEKSVDSAASKFSTLEQIGIGALRRIGEAAINAGANVFKSLAIQPITQGFGEMELKMNSTQTIMASTGESLAVVNQRLQELNEYSDKTIYSFSDMTQNIGKFTNAGVKLDMAVASIKGISNAAALAGANSNEASRAMYNFAQALSSGYVKLVDWKSIELANMATVEFKTQLLESAVAAGTVTKAANGMYKVLSTDMAGKTMDQTISATKNFNDSLSFQWMTTDALTKTLSNYADETTDIGKRATQAATQVTTFTKLMETLKESVGSGWAQTFEIIFGDFNEARSLWTGINGALGGTINELSDMRNELLSGGLGSGWKQFMKEGIEDTTTFADTLAVVAEEAGIDIDSLINKTGSMEKAIKGNWLTGEMLTETIDRMTGSIESLSDEEFKNAGYTERTKKELLKLRDALKSGTISADEFAKKMSQMSGRENIIQGLKNSVIALLTAIKPISKAFDQIFPPQTAESLYQMTELFKKFTESLIISEGTANKIQRTFAGLFAVLDIGWEIFKLLASSAYEIVGIFVPLNGNLLEMTATVGDFLVSLNRLIKQSGVFQYSLLAVKIAAVVVKNVLLDVVSAVTNFVYALWTSDRPLEFIGNTAKKVFSGILNNIKTLTSWVSGKFKDGLTTIFNLLDKGLNIKDDGILRELLDSLKEFVSFLLGGGTDEIANLGDVLNKLDFHRIATFVSGGVLLIFINQLSTLTKSMNTLVNTTNGFISKFSKKLFGFTTPLKDLAFVIGVVAASLFVLSSIPWNKLIVGLTGLAGAMLLFVGAYAAIQAITVSASKALNGIEVVKSSLSLASLAAGLIGMTIALKQLSKIDPYDVWRSVGVLTALMGIVVAYQALSAVISMIPGQTIMVANFGAMALGLTTLIGVIVVLQLLSPEAISSGLAKVKMIMGTLIAIQAVFAVAALVSGGHKLSVSLLGVAAGILGLVGVIKILSEIRISELSEGIKNVFLIGGILSAIQLMFSIAARISGGNKFKANILGMTVGLAAMVVLLTVIDNIGPAKLQNGINVLIKMAAIIVAIELLTALAARISGGQQLQKILGSITFAMLSFTVLIGVLGFMKPETINKGLATIMKMAAIILAFQALYALIGVLSGDDSGGGLLAITNLITGILSVTSALILLSMQDQVALANATKSLSITVTAVGIMAAGIGFMLKSLSGLTSGLTGFRETVAKLLPGLASMGIAIVAAVALIEVINLSNVDKISWSSLGKFVVGLGAVTALAVAFTMLAKVPGLVGGTAGLAGLVPGLAGMTAVVVATVGLFKAISFVLNDIKNISWSDFGIFTTGLALVGAMAIGITLMSPLLAPMGPMIKPILGGVLTAIAGVAMIVLSFAGLAKAIEALFKNDPEFLTRGIDKLVEIADGIGRFIGALASGFSQELIVGYGESLAGFSKALGSIDPASFAGVESLAKALLILTGTSILDGLARFMNFGQNPGEVFGKHISGLIKSFKGITVEDATLTSNIFTALKPMITNLLPLAEAASAIPNSGGLAGIFAGENEIDDFGKQIRKLITNFGKVDLTQTNHTTSIIRALAPMLDNLKTIIEIADNIPNSEGLVSLFTGENSLSDFGKQIGKFISSFNKIDISQASHTTDVIQALAPMLDNLKTIIEIADKIPNSEGLVSLFIGDNNIDDFGKNIAKMVKTFGAIDDGQIKMAADNVNLVASDMMPGLQKFVTLSNNLVAVDGTADRSLLLLNLASTLKEFVNILKGVDVSIIVPALKSLDDITESFKGLGAEVLASAKESFDNNTQPFQTSIIKFLDGINKEVESRKGGIAKSFGGIFSDALDKSQDYISEFRSLGVNIIKGLKQGIESESPSATTAINKVVKNVTTSTRHGFAVESPSKVFAEIGKWLPIGLGVGVERHADYAIKAGVNMANDFESTFRDAIDIHSIGQKWVDIGGWVPKSVQKGVEDFKGGLLDTAKNLGIDTGKLSIKGITDEIANGDGAVTTGITNLLDLLNGGTVTNLAESAGVNLGGEVGAGIGNSMTDGVRDALSNSSTGIGGSKTKEVVKSELEKLQAVLEEGKYYGTLSLEEELKAYEALRLVKGQTAEEYKRIDREVYRLVKEIYEAQLSYIEEVTNAEADAAKQREDLYADYLKNKETLTRESEEKLADLRMKYEKDMASANEQARKRIQDEDKNYHNNYNNIMQRAEEDRIKAREEYASKQKSINAKLLQDIDAQNKAYENAVKSRADAIYNSYNLFSKVEEDPEVTGEELLGNLRDQGAALSEWQQSLDALKGRGVGAALIEELQQMGPSTKAQIKALMTLTDEQLNEYVTLFQGKYAFARTKAEAELQGLKEDTKQAIQDLNTQAGIDLQNLELEFRDTMSNINIQMSSDLSDLKSAYDTTMSEINSELRNKLGELRMEFENSTAEVNSDTREKLAKMEEDYSKSLAAINTDTEKKLDDLKKQFTTTMRTINGLTEEEFKKLIGENKTKLDLLNKDTAALLNTVKTSYDQTGTSIVTSFGTNMQQLNNNTNSSLGAFNENIRTSLDSAGIGFELAGYYAAVGFAGGISSGSYMAVNAAQVLARQAVTAARTILNENSPSKVFHGIGKFVSLGFANGITDYADKAEDASMKMASGPIAAVSKALAELGSESDVWEPVISPVLDLSNIRNSNLDNILGLGKGVGLAFGSSRYAAETIQNGSAERQPESVIIQNTFNMPGMVVRKEADIDLIATKLDQKQQTAQRSRGVRTLPTGRY